MRARYSIRDLRRLRYKSITGFCGIPIGGYSGGFPTNMFVPTTPIDPLAAALSAYWPTPNTIPTVNNGGNNFFSDPHRQETRNNFDVRIDHKISDKRQRFRTIQLREPTQLHSSAFQ